MVPKSLMVLFAILIVVVPLGWFGLRYAAYYVSAARYSHVPLEPGNAEVPKARTLTWNDGSHLTDSVLSHWAAQPLPDWQEQGKVNAPRALMGRFKSRLDVDAANEYIRAVTPWGNVGSTWQRHPEGDYDFTLAGLIPILFLFGDDPAVLYPATLDHLLDVLLTVDGGETLTKDFPAGKDFGKTSTHIEQYDNWRTAYGETVAIPLAPGKHEVKLAATGKDRLEIRVSLRNYFRAPSVVVTGRRTDASAWVWARHRSSTAYSMRAGKKWDEAKGVTCLLADFAPGSYEVEWTDPWSGTVTATTVQAEDGTLPLAIPPVKRDLAAKIRKR